MYTVIFGCGNVGKRTLHFLGADVVNYFCDNNPNVIGQSVEGHEIISYQELINLVQTEEVLLVLGVNGHNAEQLAEQLDRDGVCDYVVAKELPGFETKEHIDFEILESLRSKEVRNTYMIRYLHTRLIKEKRRVDYFKRHASIYHMSPATGKLREKQMLVQNRAVKALSFLDEHCPVSCWITSGTLIGRMRHNGFIPWDDDIDFGIMREDVYKLMNFFKKYSTVFIPGVKTLKDGINKSDISPYDTWGEVKTAVGKNYFLLVFPDFIRICTMDNEDVVTELELFAFDYYREDLTIQEYASYVSDAFIVKKNSPSMKDWFDYCYDTIENKGIVSQKPTNKILPGIDSFIYRGLWNIEDFIPTKAIFPLKKVEYEGAYFLAPNDEERYMQHEYPNWKEFPSDVGDVEEG